MAPEKKHAFYANDESQHDVINQIERLYNDSVNKRLTRSQAKKYKITIFHSLPENRPAKRRRLNSEYKNNQSENTINIMAKDNKNNAGVSIVDENQNVITLYESSVSETVSVTESESTKLINIMADNTADIPDVTKDDFVEAKDLIPSIDSLILTESELCDICENCLECSETENQNNVTNLSESEQRIIEEILNMMEDYSISDSGNKETVLLLNENTNPSVEIEDVGNNPLS